jgi:hypothetical protein
MFDGCTALVTAPALPVTTLYEYCYYGMFYGCTSLSGTITIGCSTATATALPSNSIGDMFSLPDAPAPGKGITTITGHANFLARLSSALPSGNSGVFTNQTALTTPRAYDDLLTGWK